MLSKYVSPGDRIEINEIKKGNTEREGVTRTDRVYQSQVYDVISEDRLEILMPMEKTKLVLLPIDSEYELFFYTQGGLYQCYARITERYKSDNVYLIVMELISNLSKYQRREFYRLSCAINADIRYLTEQEDGTTGGEDVPYDETVPMEKAIIVDISGGGVRCVGTRKYECGAKVYIKFLLHLQSGAKEYVIPGSILQVGEVESRQGMYEFRVRFENMRIKTREEIIRYIFDEERKYRKRERGE